MLSKSPYRHPLPPANVQPFLTPNEEAVQKIRERANNRALREEVEAYLDGDIPAHFKGGPIAYLARHVATPNFETLRFIEKAKEFGLPGVIGEDGEDIFVSQNSLKRALGKMQIIKGKSKNLDDIVEHLTVVDFTLAQGMPLKDVRTYFGEPLMQFHEELIRVIYPHGISIVSESAWINRNHRGNLLQHYKKLLALFITHGVMFEHYPVHDAEENAFVTEILAPAFQFIEDRFGERPIITPLLPDTVLTEEYWESYPSVLYKLIKIKMGKESSVSSREESHLKSI